MTAAGQAFLANRGSNANLSNAAAAAALRSQTTSPTPIAEIQTKRMIQRRGSASSNGSARSGLQRRDSGGSMTERSFRDPSPSRNASSDYRYDDAPPVPALPKGYMSPPPLPSKSNRRAASVERPLERVLSPPPTTKGRGVSLDRGPGIMPSQLKARTQARGTELGSPGQADRAQNRESVNFSRPMSSAMSPPASPSPKVSNQPSSTNAPNVGRLRDGEVENIQYNLDKTAQAPVKKNKKSVAKNTEGSYLASGVSGGRAAGTMVQSTPRRQQDSAQSTPSPVASSSHSTNTEEIPRPLPKKKKKKVDRTPGSQGGDLAYGSYLSDSDSAVSDRSNATDRSKTYNTRAAGLLAKQPSIVREDREAEEEEDFRNPITNLGKSIQNGSAVRGTDNEQPKTFTSDKRSTPVHTKKSSLDIPSTELVPTSQSGTSSNPPIRQQSLSPARAAHFSAQPILETPDNLKHQPPARSISPVKSALKHSPSRGPSPVAGLSLVGSNRRGPASEASDTTSMISDDGSKSGPKKKKKHARVSFDSESVVVGRAATPPTDPDSPMIMSPQNKEASTRRWLGLGKDQDQRPPKYSKGDDTAMKPTPVLPSFGSVRERNERAPSAESDRNTTEPTNSILKSGTTPDQIGESKFLSVLGSEEAGIITQEPELNVSNDPLPPEVTSVEGTGYQSDTDNSVTSDHVQGSQLAEAEPASAIAQQDPHAHPMSGTGVALGDVIPLPPSISNEVPSIAVQPATPALGDTPSIAIQPATPGLDEYRKGSDQYWFDMPGGFPTLTDDSADDRPASSTTVENRSPDITPAAVGISEPVPEAVVTSHHPGTSVTGDAVEGLRIQTEPDSSEESDHTNNSIYSDAAEDLSDLEGDGFGSINAIVESPASPPLGIGRTKQPESPTGSKTKSTSLRSIPLNRNESEISEPGSEAGWDKAQAYWSGLSESRKQQIERAAAQGDIPDSAEKPESKPKKKKIVPKKPTQEVSQFNPDREDEGFARPSSNTRGSKAKAKAPLMKSSMRDNASESHPKTRMQSSMRGSVPAKPSIRASLPPEPTAALRGALQTRTRPLSAVSSDIYKPQAREVGNGHDRSVSLGNSPNLAAKAKSKSPQPVRRMMSNDSDSSSSFKKARSKSSDTGRYTMKRSMRGSSVDEGPGHARASSMTSRTSLPPDTARRPFSSVGPSMRSSMRDSIDSSKSTRTKSPSRFSGFGRSSKPKAAAKGPTSRFSSRFADSSDEDDGPINRRSRFADSSDEDEPTGLTPVRGIPRRIDEGDSTDLEDSSADEKPSTKATKSPAQQPTRLEGTALGAGSLRTIPEGSGSPTALMGTGLKDKRAAEKEKKKRSFFGGLGSKKVPKSEPFALPTEGREPQQDAISAKPGRPLGQTPQDAPASPRSPKDQKLHVPGSPGTVDTETSTVSGKLPKSPKLQRRISAQQAEKIQMKRGISDSWPLPQSPGGTSTPTMRPATSEGTPKDKNGTIGLSSLNKELRLDRPGLGDRQNTVETTATGGTGTVKKKKGWFKKAFGR